MMNRLVGVLILVTAAHAAEPSATLKRSQKTFQAVPAAAPTLPQNRATPEKVELGKMLFFDPRLSSSWLISCNTCHNLALGGVDLQETSIGHGWQRGPRNAPTVLNAVFNIAQFWDGRAKDLQEQAMGPVQASVEMNSSRERTIATLKSIPEYARRFKDSFGGEQDPVTFENMARAIEVFEATLITPHARFDKYLDGDEAALSAREKQGVEIFMAKGCAACHNGVNLGGNAYYPFGVVEKPGAEILPRNDKGRFAVTRTATDEYKFKSPSLRNIDLTAPYFHSGKVWDLHQAVGVMGTAQLGAKLTDDEIDAVVAFLRTLTGDQPRVALPTLPAHTPTTPRPDTNVRAPMPAR